MMETTTIRLEEREALKTLTKADEGPQWFALKTHRKEQLAEDILQKAGLRTFCPKVKRDITVRGQKKIVERPLIQNMLFAYGDFKVLNDIKRLNPFITFCYRKNGDSFKILKIPVREMELFIDSSTKMQDDIMYFRPEEVELKAGDKVRIVGGIFDGYEGILLKAKGRAKRMFLINFELLGAIGTHIAPEFVQKIK